MKRAWQFIDDYWMELTMLAMVAILGWAVVELATLWWWT